MSNVYFPIALTVGGMLLYHLAQKSIPGEMNPFHATIVAYVCGIVVCAISAFSYSGNKSVIVSLKDSNWAVYAMGVGAAAIEVGFMLAYRTGWRISLTAVATNVAATVILIPIGILIFKEQLSVKNVLGVGFCLVGLFLVARD
jgi:uncharacterized membrane protein